MGLDMYLSKKTFIGANYQHRNVNAKVEIKIEGKEVKIDPKRISYIVEAAAYWRKANHIHNWFLQNCLDEYVDDCRPIYVGKEKLNELLSVCKKVLDKMDNDYSEEHLPVMEGFFFGSSEYDEFYYSDIKETIEMLEPLLKESDKHSEFEYQASW